MILLIDNYDSFTYNLFQLLSSLGAGVQVRRNDAVTIDEVRELRPDGIVLSPGPGEPSGAGISLDLASGGVVPAPVLGVCLGHQCIGAAFGARIVGAAELVHGKKSVVHHTGTGLFDGVPDPTLAVRYHSLAVAPDTVPSSLEVTAWTEDGTIMGLRHRELPVEGVQFHPESLLTQAGPAVVQNFLLRCTRNGNLHSEESRELYPAPADVRSSNRLR